MKKFLRLILLSLIIFLFGFATGHTVYYKQELAHAKRQIQKLYQLSQESNSPIKFDRAKNRYTFEYIVREKENNITKIIPISFFSLAGRHLSYQKHGDSDKAAEIKKIIFSIKDKKTLDEIVNIIGEPDEIDSNIGNDKLQYKYKKLSNQYDLTIHQAFQGDIDITYGIK